MSLKELLGAFEAVGLHDPDVWLENDGEVAFDWDVRSDCTLSISVYAATESIGWAGLIGNARSWGHCMWKAWPPDELRLFIAAFLKATQP